jgi:hypothetical protein
MDRARLDAAQDIPAEIRQRVGEILEQEQVLARLPAAAEYRLRVEALVPAGTSLARAHANWSASHFPQVPGVPPFPCQPPGALAPAGIVRVVCACVTAASGGMSSYYGFRGQFVSLLVSLPDGHVWDARGETAS